MNVFHNIVRVRIPDLLASVPIPDSLSGFSSLSRKLFIYNKNFSEGRSRVNPFQWYFCRLRLLRLFHSQKSCFLNTYQYRNQERPGKSCRFCRY